MSKHSKNNTGSSIFTYGERQMLKERNEWGNITKRLGSESQKNFEMCSLCLSLIKNPVCCLKGHMFCKECILENLLFQKKQIKKKMQEYENNNKDLNLIKQKEEEEKKIEKIKMIEENYDNTNKKNEKNDETIKTKRFMENEINHCFWIPETTPLNYEKKKEKPKDILICPSNKPHNIKLKELINLILIKSKNDENKFMCKICENNFGIQKIIALKNCGHVMCEKCFNLTCKKIEKCYFCNKKYSQSEIINLQESGTSFSKHNNVIGSSFVPFYKY